MFEDIKAIQKTHQHTADILRTMMDSGAFKSHNHAFVLLRATMKALRDRIEPHEAIHLGGQLPALLRGFYFEGYDFPLGRKVRREGHNLNEFLDDIRYHITGYDFMDLEQVVPIALNALLNSVDKGEALQVMNQLPKDVQNLRTI